ncbi:hypothetical protein SAMN05216483_6683 [Streptomyces sp. 2131.1]|uniref:hypothetical protein n=1 Tax=Streptomyces sp. 2131.1 TaxID=1855346 RepID=UPI00089A9A05|nr:hypothetical protein [Streptomyces sp. 2131.1]SEE82839.1 hypothetical protein SAMN05216483_6683 [Streptomyces sp. 2131.1]
MSTTPATAFTYEQVEKALGEGFNMAAEESGVDVENRDFAATQSAFWAYLNVLAVPRPATPLHPVTYETYTRDQVSTALNRAVDDMAARLHNGVADDIDNFAVNAALTLLDDPDASFADVTSECYGEDADVVSGWLADAA